MVKNIMTQTKPIVLGLGNPLFQDEGFGIHVIHQLMKESLNERAELIDGGTDGLGLLGIVEKAELLLVIDAIDAGCQPGTIKRLESDEIPALLHTMLSEHQLGFQEVLALARLRGRLPQQLVLIGVQPQCLDWGIELTPTTAKTVARVKEMIYEQIDNWLKVQDDRQPG